MFGEYDVQIMTVGSYLNNCKKYKNVEKNTKKQTKMIKKFIF